MPHGMPACAPAWPQVPRAADGEAADADAPAAPPAAAGAAELPAARGAGAPAAAAAAGAEAVAALRRAQADAHRALFFQARCPRVTGALPKPCIATLQHVLEAGAGAAGGWNMPASRPAPRCQAGAGHLQRRQGRAATRAARAPRERGRATAPRAQRGGRPRRRARPRPARRWRACARWSAAWRTWSARPSASAAACRRAHACHAAVGSCTPGGCAVPRARADSCVLW